MELSVVLPVHNEAEYLPYSLASLLHAPINELVILLDRCSDNSSDLIRQFEQFKPNYKIRIVEKQWRKWKFPIAEAFETAFSLAEGDVIYTMAADIYTDLSIYNSSFFEEFDVVSFYYQNYDLHGFLRLHDNYMNFVKKTVPTLRAFSEYKKRTGHFAVKRSVWEQVHFKDVSSPDTFFFSDLYHGGYRHKYVSDCRNLHLRVGTQKNRQLRQGFHRARHGVSFWKTLLHALVYFKPYVVQGFYTEKKYGVMAKEAQHYGVVLE